jgi:hypothetical protein
MVTVFTILGIVVISGKMLIRISNRITTAANKDVSEQMHKAIPQAKIVAITAAIHQFAGGQIHIEKIEKIEEL